jgi:hypothetical protein
MNRPGSLSGDFRAETCAIATAPDFPRRFHLASKRFGAGYALALDLKFQAACDVLVIRGAAEGVGFKTLPVQPFSNARHYCRELFALTLDFDDVQHRRALLLHIRLAEVK